MKCNSIYLQHFSMHKNTTSYTKLRRLNYVDWYTQGRCGWWRGNWSRWRILLDKEHVLRVLWLRDIWRRHPHTKNCNEISKCEVWSALITSEDNLHARDSEWIKHECSRSIKICEYSWRNIHWKHSFLSMKSLVPYKHYFQVSSLVSSSCKKTCTIPSNIGFKWMVSDFELNSIFN